MTWVSAPEMPAGSGAEMKDVFSILPEKRTQVYDMKRVIKALVDKDTLFELKPRFGKSAVVGLARLGGKILGAAYCAVATRAIRVGAS